MAGSYEHIRRTNKAESYGGLDTSLVENMGDAIEAMVHMWWMIQILAEAARTQGVTHKELIKKVSQSALMIEVGRAPPVDVADPESLGKVSRLATVQAEVGFQWPGQPESDDDEDDGPPDHQQSNVDFMAAVLKSYLGNCTDSDPRLAAAWWGWRAARGEIPGVAAGEDEPRQTDLPGRVVEHEHADTGGSASDIERAPLPTDWTPTMYLRFVKRQVNGPADSMSGAPYVQHRFILQQGYTHTDGNRIWVDVPTVGEGT